MRTLYHYPVCPFSRKVRLALLEKKLDFTLQQELVWEYRPDFLKLNPAGQVPVLVDLDGVTLCDSAVIIEYLNEVYPQNDLLGTNPVQRAEARRLAAWFDGKFAFEVSYSLMFEKVMRRHVYKTGPDSGVIRQAKASVMEHLTYLTQLIETRNWLAGKAISVADLAAAAHLSVVDYFGDVPWDRFPAVKEWYMRMKSRPSFRQLLADRLPAQPPVEYYGSLDF